MYILLLIFIILLFITNIKSLYRLIKSYNFLKKYRNYKETINNDKRKIKVIIPVFNEVKNITKSVLYFKDLSDICDVIYVTTSKEKSGATYKEIEKNIKEYKTNNIKVINCPNTYGTMANQINYASSNLDSNDIIALYNIDSFPDKKTFIYVLNNITEKIVLQQVSYFDDNNNFILNSAQNWQNRWSLIYEIGKYLNNKKMEFKYSIGHGLFLQKVILDKYGYWSEEEINEDNEFGYRLIINEIEIKPIPFLEKADFANTIKIYIKQQSTWVNGPLYAFSYYKKNKKSLKNLILSILNFKAFISWWLFPLLTIIFLIVGIREDFNLFIIELILIINYLTTYNFLSNLILKEMNYCNNKYSINIISDLLFFIVHSFGSYITLSKLILNKNNIKNKYNTEK